MLPFHRSSGLSLSPTALPGRFGLGEIGPQAHHWIESLARMEQRFWHLPLPVIRYPAGTGPAMSSQAGSPLLLSFESLGLDGALLPGDLTVLPAFDDESIDYGAVVEVREAFLRLAARRFIDQVSYSPLLQHAFAKFGEVEADWLHDWALFATLHHRFEGRPWPEWPAPLAGRDPQALAEVEAESAAEMDEHKALQFLFFRQWHRLRACAAAHGIRLLADLPPLVAPDSADAWLAQGAGEPSLEQRIRSAARWVDAVCVAQASSLPADLPVVDTALLLQAGDQGWAAIEQAWDSSSSLTLCSLSTLLGAEPRDASRWRFAWDDLTPSKQIRLRTLTSRAGRR